MRKGLLDRTDFILREAKSKFGKKVGVLWSTGKDSTCMLHLIKANFGEIPWPVIHLDTSYKFKEMYDFREKLAKEWGFKLVVAKNEEALKKGIGPKTHSKMECCTQLKTETLKQVLKDLKLKAVIVSIRQDEHGIRALERYFSPRDKEFKWNIAREKKGGDSGLEALQDTELSGWNLFATDFGSGCSNVRVHPILHWTELDVWEYTKEFNLPVNPMYFAKDGYRYRSLGCEPCTAPVKSNASTIDEVIEELKKTKVKERSGRAQDKESEYVMQKLRALGYP